MSTPTQPGLRLAEPASEVGYDFLFIVEGMGPDRWADGYPERIVEADPVGDPGIGSCDEICYVEYAQQPAANFEEAVSQSRERLHAAGLEPDTLRLVVPTNDDSAYRAMLRQTGLLTRDYRK